MRSSCVSLASYSELDTGARTNLLGLTTSGRPTAYYGDSMIANAVLELVQGDLSSEDPTRVNGQG